MSELLPSGRALPPAMPAAPAPRQAAAAAAARDDTIDLREVVGVLRRHLLVIAGITAAVVAIAAWLALRARPVYQANAVIRITDSRRSLTGGLDVGAAQAMGGVGPWTDPVLSQIQVLQSRGVAEATVERDPLGRRVVPVGVPARLLRDVRVGPAVEGDTIALAFSDSGVVASDAHGARVAARYGAPLAVDGVVFTLAGAPARSAGTLVVVPTDWAVARLQRNLEAAARKSTDVIDVSYTANDPVIAQLVVNDVVSVFRELNARSAQQESRRRRIFLEEQLRQMDAQLRGAQGELSSFRSREQVYGSDQKITAEQAGLMDLDVRRGELSASRAVYQSLMAGLSQAGGVNAERLRAVVSSPGIAENPVVGTLYEQLVRYQAARDSLTTGAWGSAASNPDVQRLNALVATTEGRLVSAVRSTIENLDARIAALDDLQAKNAARLQQLPGKLASEARLVQGVEATSKMADQLREEYQKARIAEAVEAGQVEIVDLAAQPERPISRGPLFKIALGLIVGLMLGAGGAFVIETLDTAIHRKDEIETVLRVPGLAVIPQIAGRNGVGVGRRLVAPLLALPGRRSGRGGGNGRGNGGGNGSGNGNGNGNGAGHGNGNGAGHATGRGAAGANGRRGGSGPDRLVTVHDVRGTEAEAYRTLRTNLIFSQAIQSLRSIVITSPSPQDGKTTTAANLAVTFAQQGLRVIIVDGDLRKARLHAVFGAAREPGLSQVLVGQARVEDAVQATGVEGLCFLPAGALPPNPSEMLGGQGMLDLLARLREEYDVVLVDTPPIHVAADSTILGRVVDGVVLVLRAGQTGRESAQDAVHRLAAVGARVVGAVLNDPDHKVPAYGGYYAYGYYEESRA